MIPKHTREGLKCLRDHEIYHLIEGVQALYLSHPKRRMTPSLYCMNLHPAFVSELAAFRQLRIVFAKHRDLRAVCSRY